MRPLGVVVGYRGEARCLVGPDLRILCSGADAAGARTAAQHLVDEGVSGLVSFGLAGGLVADLTPGDLLLPQAVVLPDGVRIEADAAWRERLVATLERAGLHPRGAPVAGSDSVVASGAAKRALATRTTAVAVDMESHGVAEVAARARVPFLIVRAVADRSDQAVPHVVRGAIDARGDIRLLALAGRLIARPWEIGALIALGRSSGQGLASLRRVAALAPDFGFV